jgi:SAM-dependent methyltransferase
MTELSPVEVKEEIRAFYDSVGWKQIGGGLYQNARYEDLRPVCQEYITRCHRRLARHLPPAGRLLLDAGSGPIQYPEYLEYSRGYGHRVCLDLSRLALVEARARVGGHGLFVQGDLAALPFRARAFEGVVSLHALHHVPDEEQERALTEMRRVLEPGGSAAVVYSWGNRSDLMRLFRPAYALAAWVRRLRHAQPPAGGERPSGGAKGSHTFKLGQAWMAAVLARIGGGDIVVWRSVGTEFTRNLIHPKLGGRWILRAIYFLEEAFPRWFGRHGMYPLILLKAGGDVERRG